MATPEEREEILSEMVEMGKSVEIQQSADQLALIKLLLSKGVFTWDELKTAKRDALKTAIVFAMKSSLDKNFDEKKAEEELERWLGVR